MAPEELISSVRRRPFVPFRLTLTEGRTGRTYDVLHPEFCMVGKRSAVIGLAGGVQAEELLFERSVTLDLLHIVKMESIEAAAPKSNGAGGK
jgi:hypothetical protein